MTPEIQTMATMISVAVLFIANLAAVLLALRVVMRDRDKAVAWRTTVDLSLEELKEKYGQLYGAIYENGFVHKADFDREVAVSGRVNRAQDVEHAELEADFRSHAHWARNVIPVVAGKVGAQILTEADFRVPPRSVP